jgi:transcriptional regulator with XRE-family HTH domain
LIASLRLAASCTTRQLAELLGVRAPVIRRLEHSDDRVLSTLTGAQLLDLARILGTRVEAIVTLEHAPPSTGTADDAQALLTLLYGQPREVKTAHLATALGWDLNRLAAARTTLDARLEPLNLTVSVRRSPAGWRIAILDVLAAGDQTRALTTLQCEYLGLNRATTKVLHEQTYPPPTNAIGGSVMSRDRLKRLALLERIGAVTREGSGYVASDALRFAVDVRRPRQGQRHR